MNSKKEFKIFLVNPSGFCAGVSRAVDTVELSLKQFGAPIYVKHQIVHNTNIINDLESKGVIFTNDLDEIPEGSVLIFNAHGVTKEFEENSRKRNLICIDATCPLVKKVHKEALIHSSDKKIVIIIGHKNHPEVIATKSRIKYKSIVIDTPEDAHNFIPEKGFDYAFVTQTTLSVDYINEIADVLETKVTDITKSKNICYATQNRQDAISYIIKQVDGLIVVGSINSSNSNRLKEVGLNYNKPSYLINSAYDIPYADLAKLSSIAVSAGASSPDYVIKEVVDATREHMKKAGYNVLVETVNVLEENVKFLLPKILHKKAL